MMKEVTSAKLQPVQGDADAADDCCLLASQQRLIFKVDYGKFIKARISYKMSVRLFIFLSRNYIRNNVFPKKERKQENYRLVKCFWYLREIIKRKKKKKKKCR